MAFSLGIFSCVGQLWNHYDDYEFDKESGTSTYAVLVGLDTTKKTLRVAVGIHLVVLLLLFLLYFVTLLGYTHCRCCRHDSWFPSTDTKKRGVPYEEIY